MTFLTTNSNADESALSSGT